jgi:hypothetical protein
VECSFAAGFADSTGLAPFSKVGHKMPLREVQQKHRLSEFFLAKASLTKSDVFSSTVFSSEVQLSTSL